MDRRSIFVLLSASSWKDLYFKCLRLWNLEMLTYLYSVFSPAHTYVVTVVLAEVFCWEEAHPTLQWEQEGERNPQQMAAVCAAGVPKGWLSDEGPHWSIRGPVMCLFTATDTLWNLNQVYCLFTCVLFVPSKDAVRANAGKRVWGMLGCLVILGLTPRDSCGRSCESDRCNWRLYSGCSNTPL